MSLLVARGQFSDIVAIVHDSGFTVTVDGSSDVFVAGKPIHRVDDLNLVHKNGDSVHGGTPLETGSSTVFANGKAVGRFTDRYSCNAIVGIVTQTTVFAG